MKKNDRYAAILLAFLGVYVSWEGYSLGLGFINKPKPGFMVFWVGMFLTGLSILLFFQTFFSKNKTYKASLWEGLDWKRAVKLMFILIGYIIVFSRLGFFISTFLFLFLLFREGMETLKWYWGAILALVSTFIGFLLFGYFLEVQFPQGILKGMLIKG